MYYLRDYSILFLLYICCYFGFWRKEQRSVLVLKTLFFLYLIVVCRVTLMPFQFPFPLSNPDFLRSANFVPFYDLTMHYRYAKQDIILNIAMTVPFGFLFPITKRKNVIQTITLAFLCSLSIETIQLLYVWSNQNFTRTFDVTDIITNTIGALLGYIVYRIFRPIIEYLFSLAIPD